MNRGWLPIVSAALLILGLTVVGCGKKGSLVTPKTKPASSGFLEMPAPQLLRRAA